MVSAYRNTVTDVGSRNRQNVNGPDGSSAAEVTIVRSDNKSLSALIKCFMSLIQCDNVRADVPAVEAECVL